MATKSVTKYRPVLPAHLIGYIMQLASYDLISKTEREAVNTTYAGELISILAPFRAKIENAGIQPAYSTKPKQSLEESLGMELAHPQNTTDYYLDNIKYTTKEAYWRACYNKCLQDAGTCSYVEIQAAREHRYLEGLMSPSEQRAFELEAFNETEENSNG